MPPTETPIGAERHITGVGYTLEAGSIASPTTYAFKDVGYDFVMPPIFAPTEDAGQNNGNFVRQVDQRIPVTFTTKATQSQTIETLLAAFKLGVEKIILTEEGAAAGKELKFYHSNAELSYSSNEEGNKITWTMIFSGFKQGAEEYGFIPAGE